MNKSGIILHAGNSNRYHIYVSNMLFQIDKYYHGPVFIFTTNNIPIPLDTISTWKSIYKNVKIVILDDLLKNIGIEREMQTSFSRMTFLKLLAPFYPETSVLDKILYLDTDIIIEKDFTEIFEIDIDEYQFGLCGDINIMDNYDHYFIKRLNSKISELNIRFQDFKHIYYNCGVMLFNMKNVTNVFNDKKYMNLFLKLIDIHYRKILDLSEQDIVNIVFDKIYTLPIYFNSPPPGWYCQTINNRVFTHYFGPGPKNEFNNIINKNKYII